MIKKYYEFIEDASISWFGKKSKNFIVNGLSEDEVEDQFLRLKEILGCEVDITTVENTEPLRLKFFNKSYEIKIYLKISDDERKKFDNYLNKVCIELDQIKYRIEGMFKDMEMIPISIINGNKRGIWEYSVWCFLRDGEKWSNDGIAWTIGWNIEIKIK